MRNTTRVGPGEPQGTTGTRGGALAEQVPGAPDAQSPLERAEQEPRISYRYEGALGRVKLCRVTAAEWSRSWRAPQNRSKRAPRKGTRPVSARIATEASEARSVSCMGSDQHAPSVRNRSAEAIRERRETLESPVSVGSIPSSSRPAAPARGHRAGGSSLGTMDREEAGYGCSLTE